MNSLKILTLTFCVLLIPGCYAHHPGFYSPVATGAVVGALVGGVAGYAIGNNSGNRRGYRGNYRNDHHHHGRRRGGGYRDNGYRQRRGYDGGRRYR